LVLKLRPVVGEYLEPLIKNIKDLKGKDIVKVDSRYFRPTEVDLLVGDATKAKKELGWEPSYSLDRLIQEMIYFDLEKNFKEYVLKKRGFIIPTQISE
jgi:GDPmannose 4,6-dehydratase